MIDYIETSFNLDGDSTVTDSDAVIIVESYGESENDLNHDQIVDLFEVISLFKRIEQ